MDWSNLTQYLDHYIDAEAILNVIDILEIILYCLLQVILSLLNPLDVFPGIGTFSIFKLRFKFPRVSLKDQEFEWLGFVIKEISWKEISFGIDIYRPSLYFEVENLIIKVKLLSVVLNSNKKPDNYNNYHKFIYYASTTLTNTYKSIVSWNWKSILNKYPKIKEFYDLIIPYVAYFFSTILYLITHVQVLVSIRFINTTSIEISYPNLTTAILKYEMKDTLVETLLGYTLVWNSYITCKLLQLEIMDTIHGQSQQLVKLVMKHVNNKHNCPPKRTYNHTSTTNTMKSNHNQPIYEFMKGQTAKNTLYLDSILKNIHIHIWPQYFPQILNLMTDITTKFMEKEDIQQTIYQNTQHLYEYLNQLKQDAFHESTTKMSQDEYMQSLLWHIINTMQYYHIGLQITSLSIFFLYHRHTDSSSNTSNCPIRSTVIDLDTSNTNMNSTDNNNNIENNNNNDSIKNNVIISQQLVIESIHATYISKDALASNIGPTAEIDVKKTNFSTNSFDSHANMGFETPKVTFAESYINYDMCIHNNVSIKLGSIYTYNYPTYNSCFPQGGDDEAEEEILIQSTYDLHGTSAGRPATNIYQASGTTTNTTSTGSKYNIPWLQCEFSFTQIFHVCTTVSSTTASKGNEMNASSSSSSSSRRSCIKNNKYTTADRQQSSKSHQDNMNNDLLSTQSERYKIPNNTHIDIEWICHRFSYESNNTDLSADISTVSLCTTFVQDIMTLCNSYQSSTSRYWNIIQNTCKKGSTLTSTLMTSSFYHWEEFYMTLGKIHIHVFVGEPLLSSFLSVMTLQCAGVLVSYTPSEQLLTTQLPQNTTTTTTTSSSPMATTTNNDNRNEVNDIVSADIHVRDGHQFNEYDESDDQNVPLFSSSSSSAVVVQTNHESNTTSLTQLNHRSLSPDRNSGYRSSIHITPSQQDVDNWDSHSYYDVIDSPRHTLDSPKSTLDSPRSTASSITLNQAYSNHIYHEECFLIGIENFAIYIPINSPTMITTATGLPPNNMSTSNLSTTSSTHRRIRRPSNILQNNTNNNSPSFTSIYESIQNQTNYGQCPQDRSSDNRRIRDSVRDSVRQMDETGRKYHIEKPSIFIPSIQIEITSHEKMPKNTNGSSSSSLVNLLYSKSDLSPRQQQQQQHQLMTNERTTTSQTAGDNTTQMEISDDAVVVDEVDEEDVEEEDMEEEYEWIHELDALSSTDIHQQLYQYRSPFLCVENITVPTVEISLNTQQCFRLNMITSIMSYAKESSTVSFVYPYQPISVFPSYSNIFNKHTMKTLTRIDIEVITFTYLPDDNILPYPSLFVLEGLLIEKIHINHLIASTSISILNDIETSHLPHDDMNQMQGSYKKEGESEYLPYEFKMTASESIHSPYTYSYSYKPGVMSDKPRIVYTSIQYITSIGELFYSNNEILSVGYHTLRSHISLDEVIIHMDTQSCQPLYELFGGLQTMTTTMSNSCKSIFPTGHLYIPTYDPLQLLPQWMINDYTHGDVPRLHIPNFTLLVSCGVLDIQLTHEKLPILAMVSYDNMITQITYGTHISQLAGTVTAVSCEELSQPLALHTKFISNLEENTPYHNQLDFHISFRRQVAPVLEIVAENIRITYLNRTLSTLISYIRDHLIRQVIIAWKDGDLLWQDTSELYPLNTHLIAETTHQEILVNNYYSINDVIDALVDVEESLITGVRSDANEDHHVLTQSNENNNVTSLPNTPSQIDLQNDIDLPLDSLENIQSTIPSVNDDTSSSSSLLLLKPCRSSAFRFSVTVKNFEGQFPISSSGSDGLTLLSPNVTVFMGRLDRPADIEYCKGPYLMTSIWMSDLENIQEWIAPQLSYASIMSVFRTSKVTTVPNQPPIRIYDSHHIRPQEISWNLLKHLKHLEAPATLSEYNHVKVVTSAENTTICSWCSENAIGKNMSVGVLVVSKKALPYTRDINGDDDSIDIDYLNASDQVPSSTTTSTTTTSSHSSSKSLSSSAKENPDTTTSATSSTINTALTTLTLGIDIEGIDWTVTQGQYQAIAYLFMQAFTESQVHVKEVFPAAEFINIPLTDNLHGRPAPDELYKLLTSIPVHFHGGRLKGIENEPAYYDLVHRLQVSSHEYKSPRDSIPPWSYHHTHRKSLFTRNCPFVYLAKKATQSNHIRARHTSNIIRNKNTMNIPRRTSHRLSFYHDPAMKYLNNASYLHQQQQQQQRQSSTKGNKSMPTTSAKHHYKSHINTSTTPSSTHPSMKHHHNHPQSHHHHHHSTSKTGGNQVQFKKDVHHHSKQQHEYKPLFWIHFDDLRLHFYRKHYGGGNCIDVSADSLILSQPTTTSTSSSSSHMKDEPMMSRLHKKVKETTIIHDVDIHHIKPENILLGPKFLPQFNNMNRSATGNDMTTDKPADYEDDKLKTRSRSSSSSNDTRATYYSDDDDDNDEDDNDDKDNDNNKNKDKENNNNNSNNNNYNKSKSSQKKQNDEKNQQNIQRNILMDKELLELQEYYRIHNLVDWNDIWRKRVYKPHIEYNQQNLGNFRRCCVDICDTIAVIHIQTLLSVIDYFVDPIQLSAFRTLAWMTQSIKQLVDIKANMDVEIHIQNSLVCIPRIVEQEDTSVICIDANASYTHAWRGFLIAGPGCRPNDIYAEINSIFIAPMQDLRVVGVESLIDPCKISVLIDTYVLSDEYTLQQKIDVLKTILITLSPSWSRKTSKLSDSAIGIQQLSMSIYPLSYPSSSIKIHRTYIQTRTTSDDENTDNLDEFSRKDDISSIKYPLQLTSTSYDSIDKSKNDDEEEEDDQRIPSTSYELHDLQNTMTASSSDNLLQFRFSVQDIYFVSEAVKQLVDSIDTLKIQPTIQEKYKLQFYSFADIAHLPLPSSMNIHVPFTKYWKLTDTEMLAQACDVQLLLRNNTYNIKILKVELNGFQMTYNISQIHQLNVASGGSCSIWSYNDYIYIWEPVFEKATITLIAATDLSRSYSGATPTTTTSTSSNHGDMIVPTTSTTTTTTSNANTIKDSTNDTNEIKKDSSKIITSHLVRYDIYCTPVDFNLHQSFIFSMIRKLSLADVVTTSSIHLPPYRIINELGVDVICRVYIGDETDDNGIHCEIKKGAGMPIDRKQIVDVMKISLTKRLRQSIKAADTTHMIENDEHRLDIKYSIYDETFASKESMSIDREGVLSFDMKNISHSNRSLRLSKRYQIGESRDFLQTDDDKKESLQSGSTTTTTTMTTTTTTNTSNNSGSNTGTSRLMRSNTIRNSVLKYDSMNYVPCTIATMHIKNNGGRELVLRSLLTIKNMTCESMYVLVRLDTITEEKQLSLSEEWFIPIHLAHPKASLYMRLNETMPWIETLTAFHSLILQGKWGYPTRVKAEIRNLQPSYDTLNRGSGNDYYVLLKPEVRETRNGMVTKNYVPVRYPTKDSLKQSSGNTDNPNTMTNIGGNMTITNNKDSNMSEDNSLTLDDIYNLGMTSSLGQRQLALQPFCIQILPPLQLINILCISLLYRISDQDGLVCSEGLILPGEVVDIHQLLHIYQTRTYISIRIINYSWSKWIKLLPCSAPYPTSEKLVEISLTSLHLRYQTADLLLPNLDLNLTIREHVVRISCPTIICNRSGIQLDFCDTSSPESYLPLNSKPSIDSHISSHPNEHNMISTHKLLQSILNSPTPAAGQSNNMRGTLARKTSYKSSFYDITSGTYGNDDDTVPDIDDVMSQEDDDDEDDRSVTDSIDDHSINSYNDNNINKPSQSNREDISKKVTKLNVTTPSTSTIIMTIYMPYNHFYSVQIQARSDWTLLDVFHMMSNKIASHKVNRSSKNYVFLAWQNGPWNPQKVKNIPPQEAATFFTTTAKAVKALNETSVESNTTTTTTGVNTPQSTSAQSMNRLSGFLGLKTGNKTTSTATTTTATSDSSSTHATDYIPLNLQYDMVAECPDTCLQMETKLSTLNCYKLRLCHIHEWYIYRQICAMQSETIQNDGSILQMFSRPKLKFICPFMKFEGQIPFNPHHFLGFQSAVSLRVPNETGWSHALDIIGSKISSGGGEFVTVRGSTKQGMIEKALQDDTNTSNKIPLQYDIQYDFGIYAERGKGLYQNITSISIVPKHILISKVSSTILEIRQMNVEDQYVYVKLTADTIQNYHFSFQSKPKLLQIRRYQEPLNSPKLSSKGLLSSPNTGTETPKDKNIPPLKSIDTSNTSAMSPEKASPVDNTMNSSTYEWFGELDIASIGITYIKLRDPLLIIKIQIEAVGASLVSTFIPQTDLWPPYRIENKSTIDIRFRQYVLQPSCKQSIIHSMRSVKERSNTTISRVNSKKKMASILEDDIWGVDSSDADDDNIDDDWNGDDVDNKSKHNVGKRNHHIKDIKDNSSGGGGGMNVSNIKESPDRSPSRYVKKSTSKSSLNSIKYDDTTNTTNNTIENDINNKIPWDYLESGQNVPYTWDYTKSGQRILRLECKQSNLSGDDEWGGLEDNIQWIGEDILLDNFTHMKSIFLKRPIGSITRTSAENYLWYYQSDKNNWERIFAILQEDNIFLFEDDSRHEMLQVINLVKRKPNKVNIVLASVSSYKETSPVKGNSASGRPPKPQPPMKRNSPRTNNTSTIQEVDINIIRIILLRLAENMGLFGRPRDSQRRRAGVGNLDTTINSISASSLRHSKLRSNVPSLDEEMISHNLNRPLKTRSHSKIITTPRHYSHSSMINKYTDGDLYRSRIASKLALKSTLKSHLQSQLVVDELLAKLTKLSFELSDLIESLIAMKVTDDTLEAINIIYKLFQQNILISTHEDIEILDSSDADDSREVDDGIDNDDKIPLVKNDDNKYKSTTGVDLIEKDGDTLATSPRSSQVSSHPLEILPDTTTTTNTTTTTTTTIINNNVTQSKEGEEGGDQDLIGIMSPLPKNKPQRNVSIKPTTIADTTATATATTNDTTTTASCGTSVHVADMKKPIIKVSRFVEHPTFKQILYASGYTNIIVTETGCSIADSQSSESPTTTTTTTSLGLANTLVNVTSFLPPFLGTTTTNTASISSNNYNLSEHGTKSKDSHLVHTSSLQQEKDRNLIVSTELKFAVPSLYPELISSLNTMGTQVDPTKEYHDDYSHHIDHDMEDQNDEDFHGIADRSALLSSMNEGFSITMEYNSYTFICPTPHEYMHWLGNCRKNIENTWVKFVCDEDIGYNQDMSDYKIELNVNVRVDGPTNVLEITEVHHEKNIIRTKPTTTTTTTTTVAENNDPRLSMIYGDTHKPKDNEALPPPPSTENASSGNSAPEATTVNPMRKVPSRASRLRDSLTRTISSTIDKAFDRKTMLDKDFQPEREEDENSQSQASSAIMSDYYEYDKDTNTYIGTASHASKTSKILSHDARYNEKQKRIASLQSARSQASIIQRQSLIQATTLESKLSHDEMSDVEYSDSEEETIISSIDYIDNNTNDSVMNDNKSTREKVSIDQKIDSVVRRLVESERVNGDKKDFIVGDIGEEDDDDDEDDSGNVTVEPSYLSKPGSTKNTTTNISHHINDDDYDDEDDGYSITLDDDDDMLLTHDHGTIDITADIDNPSLLLDSTNDLNIHQLLSSPRQETRLYLKYPPNEYFYEPLPIVDLDKQSLSLSVKVNSVGFSIIDLEPAELMYISFQDLDIHTERNLQRLTVALTVQDVQICNQLLNPNYPVALHSRALQMNNTATAGTSGLNSANNTSGNKGGLMNTISMRPLMLPGLYQVNDTLPALHLYFQQKLHNSTSTTSTSTSTSTTTALTNVTSMNSTKDVGRLNHSESYDREHYVTPLTTDTSNKIEDRVTKKTEKIPFNLYYFELVTIWVTPMEFNLDDEIIIRSIRYVQAIRNHMIRPDLGSIRRQKEEILSLQYQGNKTWGVIDKRLISDNYFEFQEAVRIPYIEFYPLGKANNFVYFSLLQIYPLDFILRFRSLTGYSMTASESAVISVISQMDSSRFCLNRLMVEHIFCSVHIASDMIIKHYKAALWHQIHKLLGTADLMDNNSTNTTTTPTMISTMGNTSVHDVYTDMNDSQLIDDNYSLLDGISKGGKSFASHAIGGTSALTSKLTGGLGHGVSLLTMDSEFHRNRANRRLNKAKTVSQGFYVGTKELGKNIVEGVSGIVISPYRGWEENGAAGLGVGLAKGILGAALKPAVGVIDLASRASEGIRNAAFGSIDNDISMYFNIVRVRIPRHFGNNGIVVAYHQRCAAAQYMADKLTGFNRESRIYIVFHQCFYRQLSEPIEKIKSPRESENVQTRYIPKDAPSSASKMGSQVSTRHMSTSANTSPLPTTSPKGTANSTPSGFDSSNTVSLLTPGSHTFDEVGLTIPESSTQTIKSNQVSSNTESADTKVIPTTYTYIPPSQHFKGIYKDKGYQDFTQIHESWGMRLYGHYVVLISSDRLLLAQVNGKRMISEMSSINNISSDPTLNRNTSISNSSTHGTSNSSSGGGGNVSGMTSPNTRHNTNYDFKLIWSCPANNISQLYSDTRGDMIISVDTPVSTVSSWNAPYPTIIDKTSQDYLIFQLLLEQTIGMKYARLQPLYPVKGLIGSNLFKSYGSGIKSMLLAPTMHTFQLYGYVLYEYSVMSKKSLAQNPNNSGNNTISGTSTHGNTSNPNNDNNSNTNNTNNDDITSSGDGYINRLVQSMFTMTPSISKNTVLEDVPTLEKDKYLSAIYPLVDMMIEGPYDEENGKYSISIYKRDDQKMRILKRDDENMYFNETIKTKLIILFPSQQMALQWRQTIEQHIIRSPSDVFDTPSQQDMLKKYCLAQSTFPFKAINHVLQRLGDSRLDGDDEDDDDISETNSILATLVIPTSGVNQKATEALRIEIAHLLRKNIMNK